MTLPRLGSGSAAQAGMQARLEQLAHPLYPDLLHALAQYRWLSKADQLLDDGQWRSKASHLRTRTDAIAAQQRRLSGVAECPWGTLPHVDDAMVRGIELFTLAVREIRRVHSEAVDGLAAARQDVTAAAAESTPAPRMPEGARRKRNAVRGRVEDALDAVHSHMTSKRRRGRLPEASTRALLHWFMDHADHPYPTAAEKAELRRKTGLNNQQLRNWFTNMRKRHWKPTRAGREPQSAVDWLIHEKQTSPGRHDPLGATKSSPPQPPHPMPQGTGAVGPPKAAPFAHGGGDGGPASSPVPFRAPHRGARPSSPVGSHTAAAAVAAAAASAASIRWETWAGGF